MWTRRSAHRIRRSPHRRRRIAAPTPRAEDRPPRAVNQRLRLVKRRRRRDDCRHRRVRRRQSRRQRHRASSFRGRGNLLSGRVLICGHAENHRPHTERRAAYVFPARFRCCLCCASRWRRVTASRRWTNTWRTCRPAIWRFPAVAASNQQGDMSLAGEQHPLRRPPGVESATWRVGEGGMGARLEGFA